VLLAVLSLTACAATPSARPVSVAVPQPVPPTTAAVSGTASPSGPATPEPVARPSAACVESVRPMSPLPPPGSMPAHSTMAEIQQRGYLIAGVDQDSYAFGFRNPAPSPAKGQAFEGFDIDILHAIAQAIFGDPDDIMFVPVNQDYRVGAAHQGVVDVVSDSITITCGPGGRKSQADFSADYFDAQQKLLVPRGSTASVTLDKDGVAHVVGLRGQKVCTVGTTTSIKNISALQQQGGFHIVLAGNWSDCLVMLQQGQVQAVTTDNTILGGMVAEDPYLRIAGQPFSFEPHGLAFPQNESGSSGNTQFVGFVNAVLARLESSSSTGYCPASRQPGTSCWLALYQKWIEPQLGPPTGQPVPEYAP
jgi:polar amino acid transport system substrate-binding protein